MDDDQYPEDAKEIENNMVQDEYCDCGQYGPHIIGKVCPAKELIRTIARIVELEKTLEVLKNYLNNFEQT